MRPDERRDASIAALAVGLSGLFLLRIFIGDPGPLELVAVLAAAYFLGPRSMRWAAAVASVLLVAAALLEPGISPVTVVARIALLVLVGELVASLVEDRRRQARELGNLRWIQDVLAPAEPPELPLLEVATRYVPAEHGVAGDFYLVVEGHNNATIFVLGDVAGKGMEAAKRATFVRATLTACAGYSDDPLYLLRMANAELIRQHGTSSEFITMLCVVVRPDGTVVWSSAGHPPPISLADGSPIGEPTPAYPLGIAPELDATTWRTRIGDAGILLYTDGLTDARPPGRTYEPFGAKRLANALEHLRDRTPENAVDELVKAARRFARGALPDDLCLVAVRSKVSPRGTVGDPAAGDGRELGTLARPRTLDSSSAAPVAEPGSEVQPAG